jgi:hypothetical protein
MANEAFYQPTQHRMTRHSKVEIQDHIVMPEHLHVTTKKTR